MANEASSGGNLLTSLRSARILISGLCLLLTAVVIDTFHTTLSGLYEKVSCKTSQALSELCQKAQTFHSVEPYIVLLNKLCEELGFAFIIGWIISVAIEQASRQELNSAIEEKVRNFNDAILSRLDDIQHRVFHSTFRRNIPKHFVDEIELLIFRSDFLRRNHRWNYELTMISAPELDITDHFLPNMPVISAEVTMSYEVENISLETREFEVRVNLELPPFDGLKKYVKIERVSINGEELSREEIEQGTEVGKSSKHFKKTINAVRPGEKIHVWGKCRTVKMQDDVELWRSLLPSEGLMLSVHFPRQAKAKGAAALHRIPLAENAVTDDHCEWSINGPVLPQQGFLFWWRCSDEPPSPKQMAALIDKVDTSRASGDEPPI